MKKTETRALVFKILMLMYILTVMYLCFADFKDLPDVPKTLWGIPMDKIVHFCMFFPFPILGFYAYDTLPGTPLKAFAAIIVLFSFGGIFAGLTETVQGMMPYRTEDIADFKADLLALALSSVIVFAVDFSRMKLHRK